MNGEDKENEEGFDTRNINILIKKRKKEKRIIRIVTAALAVMFSLGICAAAFSVYVSKRIDKTADVGFYRMAKNENVTRLYYTDSQTGEVKEIAGSAVYPAERHLFAPYDTIPKDLINAFVAIEDKRFYLHEGVDWYRTAGAGLNYIFNFRDSFGASTITQQLVKNVTGNDEYKIDRKIQEIFYALSLEEQMDKSEILELYLNVINLSRGCRGVRSASLTYFSKELSELSLIECVCLAAITNSPNYYDPYLNPENNKYRRQLILGEMLTAGYIDEAEYNENYDADVILSMNEEYTKERVNSWYAEMVISDVAADLCDRYGYDESEAWEMIYGGGLHIYTMMDPTVQSVVESYYSDESNFPDSGSGIRAQTSMIIIDPYTGGILGVAGAVGKKNANRVQNYATDTLRPSGSVIKPLSVYAPALEKGLITYSTVFDDIPVKFIESDRGSALTPWPNNAPTIYHGLVNVNYAVEVSLNTVPVKILDRLGKNESFYFLKNTLGMENLIEGLTLENGSVLTDIDVASLAMGQMNYGVTVREITAGYTIFANEGNYCEPRSYYLVTDSMGNVLLEKKESERPAISRDNAYIMNKMLMNVVDKGTAEGISLDKITPVAGKTGTSEAYYDRWFIGYTAKYLGGVWYGYEYPKALENDTKHICTEIWDDVMSEIYKAKGEGEQSFFDSDNVVSAVYCRDSGKLMTDACRADPRGDRSQRGYFVKGTEPKTRCNCHVFVGYDKFHGGIADPSCPSHNVTQVGLIQIERHFPMQIYVSDAQYVYRELPSDILPGDSDGEPFFINTLPKGDYCGISYTEKQYNRYCHQHFNYLAWLLRRNVHN